MEFGLSSSQSRILLAELDHSGTKAAVIIRKINNVEHLCGYFSSGGDIDPEDFRNFLASRLTPYMVPTVLMRLEQSFTLIAAKAACSGRYNKRLQ